VSRVENLIQEKLQDSGLCFCLSSTFQNSAWLEFRYTALMLLLYWSIFNDWKNKISIENKWWKNWNERRESQINDFLFYFLDMHVEGTYIWREWN
jgi:hypothetical protein